MTTSTIPVDAGLFTWPSDGEPRLIGGRCRELRRRRVPAAAVVRPVHVGGRSTSACSARTGTLWSWTVQRFEPKEPYVGPSPSSPTASATSTSTARCSSSRGSRRPTPSQLEIGQPMELVVVPFTTRADGTDVVDVRLPPVPGGASRR